MVQALGEDPSGCGVRQVGFSPSPAACQQWEPEQVPPGASVSSSGKWVMMLVSQDGGDPCKELVGGLACRPHSEMILDEI